MSGLGVGQPHEMRSMADPMYLKTGDPGYKGGGTYSGGAGDTEGILSAYENVFGPAGRDIKLDSQRQKRPGFCQAMFLSSTPSSRCPTSIIIPASLHPREFESESKSRTSRWYSSRRLSLMRPTQLGHGRAAESAPAPSEIPNPPT